MRDAGIENCVAVDMACARVVHREGMDLGHIGHLVQIPLAEAAAAATMKPANWTVFSQEKAREAATAAAAIGASRISWPIHAPQDTFYSGQEGGFAAGESSACRGSRRSGRWPLRRHHDLSGAPLRRRDRSG